MVYTISPKASPYLQNYQSKAIRPVVQPANNTQSKQPSTQVKSGVDLGIPAFTNFLTANSKVQAKSDPVRDFIGTMINPEGGTNFINTILGHKGILNTNPLVTKSKTKFVKSNYREPVIPSQNMQLPKTNVIPRDKKEIIDAAKNRYQARQSNKIVSTESVINTGFGTITDIMNQQKTSYNQNPKAFSNAQINNMKMTPDERQQILRLYNKTGDPNLKKLLTHAGNMPKQNAINAERARANAYLQSQHNPGSYMGKTITARDLFRY